MQGNREIFYSAQRHYGFRHRDHRGRDVGKSVEQAENRIDHFSPRDESNRIGFDVLYRSARLIRHFDKDEREIGETQVRVDGDQGEIEADAAVADYLETFADFDEGCPAATRQRDVFNEVTEQCAKGSRPACNNRANELALLRELERNCLR